MRIISFLINTCFLGFILSKRNFHIPTNFLRPNPVTASKTQTMRIQRMTQHLFSIILPNFKHLDTSYRQLKWQLNSSWLPSFADSAANARGLGLELLLVCSEPPSSFKHGLQSLCHQFCKSLTSVSFYSIERTTPTSLLWVGIKRLGIVSTQNAFFFSSGIRTFDIDKIKNTVGIHS